MVFIETPKDVITGIASRCRRRRLELNITQVGLAERAGISVATLRVFERSGKISLKGLVEVAAVLGDLPAFTELLAEKEKFASLDEVIAQPTKRLRGRLG